MSTRAALNHIAKVVLQQKVAPVAFDQPHFLFDRPCDLPVFGEHQICVTPYEGHLAELKLIEWREVLAALLRDDGSDLVETSGLQLEPLV